MSSSEKNHDLPQDSQWESEQDATRPEIEFDLDVLAQIMKGIIVETRKTGEMRLIKMVANEGGDLFHNGIRISAKTVVLMINGKSEPELLAGEYAHIINDDTIKIMFNCIGNAEQFRKFSDELYSAHEKMREIWDGSHERPKKNEEPQIAQKAPEIVETTRAQEAHGIREELENTLKPRF